MVSSNTSWSWADDVNWLTAPWAANQRGDGEFTYSVEPNTTSQVRSAIISITAGNIITRTHTVTQEAAGITLNLNSASRSIGKGGGDLSFTVFSNTNWSWTDDANWLTAPWATTQSGNRTFTYSVAPNTSTQARTATISFTAGNITRTHTVIQTGAGNTLTLNPTTRNIGAGGDVKSFTVSSNTNWNWTDNATWLTSNESATQTGTQTFTYSVGPNTSTQVRSATISITAGNTTRMHTVIQAGAGSPTILTLRPEALGQVAEI